MLTFDGPVDAVNALQDFLIERTAALPDRLRDKLRDLLKERSPVVTVVGAVEFVYGRQERDGDVPEEMRDWAAAAAAMTEDHGFHAMDSDSRGSRIAKRLRGLAIAEANIPQVDADVDIEAPADLDPSLVIEASPEPGV